CFQCIVGVDQSQIHFFQNAWQHSRFHFFKLQVFLVFHDIFHGTTDAYAVFQLDYAMFLQKGERASVVGWIIWKCNGCSFS
ncbi:hypothetical protein MA20_48655, partial [Bradyrhizobium japonicum]